MSGALTHPPSRIVHQLLLDQALGTDPADDAAWPIFYGLLPESPDNALATFDTSGVSAGKEMIGGRVVEGHGIQILARGLGSPWAKLQAIATTLDGLTRVSVTLESSTYSIQAFARRSNVMDLGMEDDASRRRLCSVNFTVTLIEE